MAEPIYITISNTPHQIIHVMDGLLNYQNQQDKRLQHHHRRLETYAEPIRQRFWLSWSLLASGSLLFLLEHLLNLRGGIFAYTALACWVAALATAKFLVAALAARSGLWHWLPWAAIILALIGIVLFRAAGTTSTFAGLIQIAAGSAVAATILRYHTSTRTPTSTQHTPQKKFPPHYNTARQIIATLRDDIAPKTTITGHLDLTGPRKKEKLMRQSKNTQGRSVDYYRDEWFSLKSKLYDGSLLRLSLLENVKERLSYTKRSRSGRNKTKPTTFKNTQEIKVRITANPHLYRVPGGYRQAGNADKAQYTITTMQVDGNTLTIQATAPQTTIVPHDILSVLQFAYSHLEKHP